MTITVSIVGDDQDTREELSHLISRTAEVKCVTWHVSAEDAMEQVPDRKPDVLLMDINLPGMSGVDAVRKLKIRWPRTQFIMLATGKDTEAIFHALMAGANGCLLKQIPPGELLAALREVCAGGAPGSSQMAGTIIASIRQTRSQAEAGEGLSAREQEVLGLLSEGYLYKEIAHQLQITYRTVSTHIEHIYEKLQVHSRAQAVAKHRRPSS